MTETPRTIKVEVVRWRSGSVTYVLVALDGQRYVCSPDTYSKIKGTMGTRGFSFQEVDGGMATPEEEALAERLKGLS